MWLFGGLNTKCKKNCRVREKNGKKWFKKCKWKEKKIKFGPINPYRGIYYGENVKYNKHHAGDESIKEVIKIWR